MRFAAAGLLCLTALLAAGCGTDGKADLSADKTAGKQLFINGPGNGKQSCGSCHVLADAGTLGKIGPNLDYAFATPRAQGYAESTIADVVKGQIALASPPMPQDIVTGDQADQVAAYVASVAGLPPGGASGTTSEPGVTTPTATTQTATTQATQQVPTNAPPTTGQTTSAGTTTTQTETGGGAAGNAAQGKTLYTSLGCVGCHSIDGSKGTGPTFKGLYDSSVKLTGGKTTKADDEYLLESIFDPDKQIAAGFQPGIMSAVIKPGAISQSDAKALVAYIETLK